MSLALQVLEALEPALWAYARAGAIALVLLGLIIVTGRGEDR